jgi:prepilin-type processing-associated H-X9-DG protein
MAIISLLLGLIVEAFQPTKDDVIKAMCDSNLKNLYLALQMYIGDNDGQCPNPKVTGQIPISEKFMEALLPYLKSKESFWCPNDREKSKHPGGSYGWRVTRDPKTSIAGVKLNLLRHPERVIIAGELSHGCHESEMINVLYADGHIGQVTMGELLENFDTPLEF